MIAVCGNGASGWVMPCSLGRLPSQCPVPLYDWVGPVVSYTFEATLALFLFNWIKYKFLSLLDIDVC